MSERKDPKDLIEEMWEKENAPKYDCYGAPEAVCPITGMPEDCCSCDLCDEDA